MAWYQIVLLGLSLWFVVRNVDAYARGLGNRIGTADLLLLTSSIITTIVSFKGVSW